MSRSGADAARRAAEAAALAQAREIYRAILSRAPESDINPTRDRIEQATDLLGRPQDSFRTIHVAGTNGKTSTARMIASLLEVHGLRVGLFTSPHLTDLRERIVIDGAPITPVAFIEAWEQTAPIVDLVDARSQAAGGPRMSFFELLTALAFVAFADAPVDVAVIEVGIGGRWDATNVINADVQVITPISRDHEAYLGSDLAGIAAEKAGIISQRGAVVVGYQRAEVAEVIADTLAEREAGAVWLGQGPLDVVGRQPAVGGQLLSLHGLGGDYEEVFLPLYGPHQGANAALALAAVELFFGRVADRGGAALAAKGLDGDVVRAGFERATSPGRLEVVAAGPMVLVDAAHNLAGAQALVEALDESFPQRFIGLVGILGDKDAEAILGTLEPALTSVVITRSTSPRAIDPVDLGEIARDVFGPDRVEVIDRLDDALARAMDLAAMDGDGAPGPVATGVLATGSVTMAAEVRILLGKG